MKLHERLIRTPVWQIWAGCLIGIGASVFNMPFLYTVSFVWGILALFHFVIGRLGEYQLVVQLIDDYKAVITEYRKKPYRQYLMDLNCAHCGHKNEVDFDLSETEFQCGTCKKYNAIHINLLTAAIEDPTIPHE